MLKLGRSKSWPEALEKLTNKRSMDVGPMKEYFWPLYLWLRKQRCSSNYTIGWPENPAPKDDPCIVPTTLPNTDSHKTQSYEQARGKAHALVLNTAGKFVTAVSWMLLCWKVIIGMLWGTVGQEPDKTIYLRYADLAPPALLVAVLKMTIINV